MIPESPAGKTGMLFTGDHVVAIGDVQLDTSDQNRAVQAIKDQGFTIKFTVRSLCKVFQVSFFAYIGTSTVHQLYYTFFYGEIQPTNRKKVKKKSSSL